MSQSAHEGVPWWLEWAAQSNAEEHAREGREAQEREGGEATKPADADGSAPDKEAR